MSLKDILQPGVSRGGTQRLLPKILAALSEEDRAFLEGALDDPENYSTRAIADALTAYGYVCSSVTVAKERARRRAAR